MYLCYILNKFILETSEKTAKISETGFAKSLAYCSFQAPMGWVFTYKSWFWQIWKFEKIFAWIFFNRTAHISMFNPQELAQMWALLILLLINKIIMLSYELETFLTHYFWQSSLSRHSYLHVSNDHRTMCTITLKMQREIQEGCCKMA